MSINPQTNIELKLEGLEYKIDGCFKHKHYKTLSSFSEPSLTSLVVLILEFHRNLVLEGG